jgi:hypothetical protein
MKIQIGAIQMNKTKRFLYPCLKQYGIEYERKFNSIFKVAIGVGDIVFKETKNYNYEQHLFVLIDIAVCKPAFKEFIEWIREHQSYEEDYAFDDINKGRLHMVVIKLPEQYYKAIHMFRKSQFSKMYNMKQINDFFDNNLDTKKILVKHHSYKIEYTKKLNEKYGTTIQPNEIQGEFEEPINPEEELFNGKNKKK